ncbi:MAG: helix-turn-helix transcriptional regulator [Ruminococcaceae bacterium]|nr:helix-turn-helix transcriptional regulator [Oscillospiraceae bacterium]
MYEIDKEKFGGFVAQLRKEKGFTQKELAEKLFISAKAVSKWETGTNLPDTAMLMPLAEILDISVTELLLCKREEKDMPVTQVENVVKTVIAFSDGSSQRGVQIKRRNIAVVAVLVVAVLAELVFVSERGLLNDDILTFEVIAFIAALYFFIFAKEKLPAYYDQNRISTYSDGFFRMNVPFLTFNNSNWPHIINVGRIWAAVSMIVLPILYLLVDIFAPKIWMAADFVFILLFLCGLFVPVYIVGKKYE